MEKKPDPRAEPVSIPVARSEAPEPKAPERARARQATLAKESRPLARAPGAAAPRVLPHHRGGAPRGRRARLVPQLGIGQRAPAALSLSVQGAGIVSSPSAVRPARRSF